MVIAKGLLLFAKEELFIEQEAFAFAKGVLLFERGQMAVAKEQLPFEKQEMAFEIQTTAIAAGLAAIAAATFSIAKHPLLIATQHMAIAKQTTAIEAGATAIAAATMPIAKQHAAIARQTAAFEVGENEGFRGKWSFEVECMFSCTLELQTVRWRKNEALVNVCWLLVPCRLLNAKAIIFPLLYAGACASFFFVTFCLSNTSTVAQ